MKFIFTVSLFIFSMSSEVFADQCLMASNGTVKCGGVCAMNSDGSVSCSAGTGLPGECVTGQNGFNTCGGKCMLDSSGIAVCSSSASCQAKLYCTCEFTRVGSSSAAYYIALRSIDPQSGTDTFVRYLGSFFQHDEREKCMLAIPSEPQCRL